MIRKTKQIEGREHIISYAKIHSCKTCKDCPIRVFAKDEDNVILGIGNIFATQWIVLPAYNATKSKYKTRLDILIEVYKELIGKELLEDFYITRDVKCVDNSSYRLYMAASNECRRFLNYEYIKLNPKHIIWFSDNLYDCPFENSTTIMSCAVMFYDNEKVKQKFKEEFMNAIRYD